MSEKRLTREEIIQIREEHMLPSVFAYYQKPIQLVKGEMQRVWDSEGKEYLDAFGGIVTISVGHCHPDIVPAVQEQLATLQHTTCVYLSEPMALLAQHMANIAPGDLSKCFFPNSGSEANEVALLMAKNHTQRPYVVGLRHAYHGGTSGVLALVGQHPWRHSVPLTFGVVHALQPNCFRCSLGLTYPNCDIRCARDVEELIKTTTSGEIAAFIAEPIQGFGGFVVPPPEYFQVIHAIVKSHGGLFIADEVQTGVGRTGKHWFGIEHWGVQPDIMTMAKGFGNGASIGGVVTTPEVAASMKGKLHFNTFGGNPGPTTQALRTLEVIEREGYLERNHTNGETLMGELKEVQKRHRIVGEVRGKGLLMGIELVKDQSSLAPATEEMAKVMEYTKDHGLLIGKGGMYGNVVRLTPPFCITDEDISTIVHTLDEAFTFAES